MADETRDLTAQHTGSIQDLSGEAGGRERARVPALTVLYHPDVLRIGDQAVLPGLARGRSIALSRYDPEFTGGAAPRPLGDLHLSRSPLHLVPAGAPGSLRLLVGESRTRVVADGEPVPDRREISAADAQRGVVLELADRVVVLLHLVPEFVAHAPIWPELVGENEGIRLLRNEIGRVADLDVPILIRGETGTGKELVARAIHETGRRRNAVCLSVNMGAIPPNLATSELFGAVRGSYTGAVRDQLGYFQRAHGGTLFLDEIGETPLDVQVMLLRALETGEVQRVGSPQTQKVDVRLIAATDSDLERAIADGRFRAPLLHRLSGYEIYIPPLRERRDDFGRLLLHFLRQELAAVGEESRLQPLQGHPAPWLPASLVARLARHPWPGNVRQLRNAVRQIVIDSRSFDQVQVSPKIERLLRETVSPAAPEALPASGAEAAPRRRAQARSYRSPTDVAEAEILAALRESEWEVKSAASRLGISRPSLYVLIDKMPGIRKAVELSRGEIQDAWDRTGGDLSAMVHRLEVSKRGLLQRLKQLGIG